MASQAQAGGSAMDTVKLIVSALLILAGIGAYHYYGEYSQLYRVLGMLGVTGVAIAIALTTAQGRALWGFLQEARAEVRKMVWPTRTETVQTTLAVFVVVLIVAVFMWLLDMVLAWAVGHVIR